MFLSSDENPKIKRIQQLNSSSKFRFKYNQFVLENSRYIQDAIKFHSDFIEYLVLSEVQERLVQQARDAGLDVFMCDESLFKKVSHVQQPEGCFAVLSKPEWGALSQPVSLALALDSIGNPSNLGAVLRNAHAFGVEAVFLLGESCDVFHPECVRAAAGQVFNVPVFSGEDLHLDSYVYYVLDAGADLAVHDVPKVKNMCFVLGSEAGYTVFSHEIKQRSKSCYIPMSSSTESLNLAVASGVALYAYACL